MIVTRGETQSISKPVSNWLYITRDIPGDHTVHTVVYSGVQVINKYLDLN